MQRPSCIQSRIAADFEGHLGIDFIEAIQAFTTSGKEWYRITSWQLGGWQAVDKTILKQPESEPRA